jgi:acetamidase/formamidase
MLRTREINITILGSFHGGKAMKKLAKVLGLLGLGVLTTAFADSEKNCLPFLSGQLDQANMIAPSKVSNPTSTKYILPATPATSQWGVYDADVPPVLRIKSGDTVAIETMAASDNQVIPGATIEQIIQIQTAVPNRGPHTLTGPIYVAEAEPGDTLHIHINKIIPRSYASNNTGPHKGLFPEEFPTLQVKYFYLDLKNRVMQFAPGIEVPLAPFPGIVAVAQAESGKFSSGPPGKFGGNMDLRVLTEGSTLYLPVFRKGGLIWTGDSHAGQGNGEIDLTAIETAFAEFNITVDVIKNKVIEWPRAETKDSWVAVGYDKDLNKAYDIMKDQTIQLIAEVRKVSPKEAEKILLATWNCPIAEVVNGVLGTYCMVPKNTSINKPYALLKADNNEYFVTYGKDVDLEKAMKIASMDMINKVSKSKNLPRQDVYTLASFAMDCRIAPPAGNEKEVHCSLAKSLWVK